MNIDTELIARRCEGHPLKAWFGAGWKKPYSNSPSNRWWLLYQSNIIGHLEWTWVEGDVGFSSLEELKIWCDYRNYNLVEVLEYD